MQHSHYGQHSDVQLNQRNASNLYHVVGNLIAGPHSIAHSTVARATTVLPSWVGARSPLDPRTDRRGGVAADEPHGHGTRAKVAVPLQGIIGYHARLR